MRYLDLHTHSLLSYGVDTPSRMRYQAKCLGIEIGLCDGMGGGDGAVVQAGSLRELINALKGLRGGAGYLIVEGRNEKVMKAALTKRGVDMVSLPGPDSGWGFDSIAAKRAEEMNVAVELNLGRLIRSYRMQRAKLVAEIKGCLTLKRKYGFDLAVTSGACSRYGLRKGEQVFELLKLLGFSEEEAGSAMLDVPFEILESKENRLMRGVRVRP